MFIEEFPDVREHGEFEIIVVSIFGVRIFVFVVNDLLLLGFILIVDRGDDRADDAAYERAADAKDKEYCDPCLKEFLKRVKNRVKGVIAKSLICLTPPSRSHRP